MGATLTRCREVAGKNAVSLHVLKTPIQPPTNCERDMYKEAGRAEEESVRHKDGARAEPVWYTGNDWGHFN